jgi:hypothetical protein
MCPAHTIRASQVSNWSFSEALFEPVRGSGLRLKTNRGLLLIVGGGLRPVATSPSLYGLPFSDRAGASCESLARDAGLPQWTRAGLGPY